MLIREEEFCGIEFEMVRLMKKKIKLALFAASCIFGSEQDI